MADYTELVSRALAGDGAALGALYAETVATVYYSSLKIVGSAYGAHAVTVRTYLLGFGNLGRLAYPEAFPVWLDRLSVYLACHALPEGSRGAAADEAKARLVAFLRDFHRMTDGEIAALLALEEQAVSGLAAAPEPPVAEDFLIGKDTVLGIWHDICSRTLTPLPGEAPPAAPAAEAAEAGAEPASAQGRDVHETPEYRKKRARRYALRIAAAALACLLISGAVWAALRSRSPRDRLTQRQVEKLANTLSLQLSGRVGEVYPISEDMYFVSINLGYGGVEGLTVQYELAENAVRVSTPEGAALSQEALEKLTGERYMQVLYDPEGSGAGSIAAGSSDAAPGETPPPAAGTPAPTKTPLAEGAAGQSFELVEGVQDFSILLRINCRNVDFSRPLTVVLDSAILKPIGDAGGLQIVLNDETHCVTLSNAQLTALCSAYGTVTLRLTERSARQYDVAFFAADGSKLSVLDSSMTFTLPADGPMTYVFARYDSGTESRGGVYDARHETVTFPVYRSGVYEMLGRETELRDADAMDAETAQAAFFLVSLNFLPPDSAGRFRPEGTLKRSEAASVIGRMFLATDPALQSEYSDVDLSDPAYDYISFGTASRIFTGLSDGSFRGDAEISREDLLTVLGRTLCFRRGGEPPAAPDTLGFDDEADLAPYARGAVAALLEAGVLVPGGALRPDDAATRGEAAVLLYRMYCILYGYVA